MQNLLLIVATSLLFVVPSQAAAKKDAGPNFLVILCDDLGWGDVGFNGNKIIRTPHLDKLAKQGFRLTDCYSAAPVCSPSRVGLLTGRTPSRVGVYDWIPGNHPMHMSTDEITIATLLKQGGYDTGLFGKWHCNGKFNSDAQPQPDDHGFNYWFATQNNASPTHANPRNFVRNGKSVGRLNGFSCQLVADEAIDWMANKRDKSKPFFSFVCFHEPHEPCASPADMIKYYENKGATKRGEAIYYANVENMDAAVGKLIKALDDQGLADNTLVFFTSDNGPETLNRYGNAWRSHGTAGPLRGMKLWLYEGGIRVPGILRFPGRTAAGKDVSEPVCSVDLLPTFCELAGVEAPSDRALDGASFTSIFQGKPVKRQSPLYWHYFRAFEQPKTAMRIGDYMILGHWDGPNLGPGGSVRRGDQKHIKTCKLTNFELYNLREDLGEQKNLAKLEPDRLKKYAAMLTKKYEAVQKEGRIWETVDKPKK